jgi:hypothetical protein
MPPAQDPMPLFDELCAIHRAIFDEQFERKDEWSTIASFECEITRHSTGIKLHKTTCWVTPDRDPRGCLTLVFPDPEDALLGAKVSNAAISRALGKEGDTKIILGFANNEHVASQAILTNLQNGGLMVALRSIGKKKIGKKKKGARRR